MPEFRFTVLETVVQEKTYTVIADTQAQAHDMACRGETESEEFVKIEGVVERDVFECLTPNAD